MRSAATPYTAWISAPNNIGLPLLTTLAASATLAQAAPTIDVHRDANCGCCKQWIEHLSALRPQVSGRWWQSIRGAEFINRSAGADI